MRYAVVGVAFVVAFLVVGGQLRVLAERDMPERKRFRVGTSDLCALSECTAKGTEALTTEVITGHVQIGKTGRGGKIGYNESGTQELCLCAPHAAMARQGRWPIAPGLERNLPWYTFCISGILVGAGFGIYTRITS
jgi:hypothetical protein